MKYIRTKYGIHTKNIFGKETSEEEWKSMGYKIVAQADTIEELCDTFVIKVKTGYLIIDHYDKKLLEQDATQNGANVYGAIWTEWGLKYVAKINENGDLELL